MGRRPPSVGILKSLDGRRARKYPENSEVEFGLCSLAPFCGGRGRERGREVVHRCWMEIEYTPTEERVPNNPEFERTSGRTWPRSSGTFGTV